MSEKADAGRVDLNELKSGGFIKQNQKDLFTVRLRVPGGRLDIDKMIKIGKVAKKYSRMGYCHLSVRQSVEIIGVHIDDFDTLVKELAEFGQPIASCGPRVRVPTACGGCEYNPNGIMDAQKKALEVDKEHFGIPCHHKFKISFSGCPIDCARTQGMDLGFQGIVDPHWEDDPCTGCTLCEKACLEGAIVAAEDGKPIFYREKCVYCGDCIKACPTDAWTAKRKGWAVRAGGKHGRHPRKADEIMLFLQDDKVSDFIGKTLAWYNKNGKRGERIGATFDRVGLENYKEEVARPFITD
jgi:dissimilatory sulfite reductase (desulfoviridin) alpha/beta subunit